MLTPEELAELDGGDADTGDGVGMATEAQSPTPPALPPAPDFPALEAPGEYAYAITNVTIRSFLMCNWSLGYFIPVVRGSSRATSYHAPDPDSDKPETPCDNCRPGDKEWQVVEWYYYRLFAEPCGTAECQEQFEKMGLDVHGNGRGR